jgi:hypothetical protein
VSMVDTVGMVGKVDTVDTVGTEDISFMSSRIILLMANDIRTKRDIFAACFPPRRAYRAGRRRRQY